MRYPHPAGKEDGGAVRVERFESAVGALDGAVHGDDARWGGVGFVVQFGRHAGAFAHDKGDGGCGAGWHRLVQV